MAQPGMVTSSTKLNSPIWLRYRTTSNSVGEITRSPSNRPLISLRLEMNLGSWASTSFSMSCTTVQTSCIVLRAAMDLLLTWTVWNFSIWCISLVWADTMSLGTNMTGCYFTTHQHKTPH